MAEVKAGPPMHGAPWFKATSPPLPEAHPPPPRQVYAQEVHGGPPLRGAPWQAHVPVEADAASQPRAISAAPVPPVYAAEVHGGPPLRGAPWQAHLPQEPDRTLSSRPAPPSPPPPPFIAHVRPFVPRVPDLDDVRRSARHTEIVASIINSLLARGQIVQTGPETFIINPAGTSPGGGLTGSFNTGSFP